MADWDPFGIDESPAQPAASPDVSPETVGELGNVARIRKEDMETVANEILGRLSAEKPWERAPNMEPDLGWHTPTCTAEDWRHHDVRLELGNGIAYVIFNRPNENNSMQDTLGAGINDVLYALHARPDIRVAVFTGEGRMYCAGGDPKGWQAAAAAAKSGEWVGDGTAGVRIPTKPNTPEVNKHLAELAGRALAAGAFPDGNVNIGRLCAAKQWATWATLPQFTICLANGSAMGGGVGCVCCCDYVISVKRAYFVLSEVKIGVIPATISPYVVAKMGMANSKRLFCAAENLTAQRAQEVGMVNEVVENMAEGHKRVQEIVRSLSLCGPRAVQLCKRLVVGVAGQPLGEALSNYTCSMGAVAADSEEASAGLGAESAGKEPPWQAKPIGYDVWPDVGVTAGMGTKK